LELFAELLYFRSNLSTKLKLSIPAISVHGVCGALGTLAISWNFFATDGGLLLRRRFRKLGVQAIGVFYRSVSNSNFIRCAFVPKTTISPKKKKLGSLIFT
jgi:ammonia channel protein AmtB